MAAFSQDFRHRSLTLIHVPGFLSRHGVRATRVFQNAGISPSDLSDPEKWLPRDKCFAIEAEAVRLTNEHLLGPKSASAYQLHELGMWGRTTSEAPNLMAALQFASDTIDTLQLGTALDIVRRPKHVHFALRYLGGSRHEPEQHVLGSLVVMRKIAMLAGEPGAVSVRLARRNCENLRGLEEFIGTAIEFGCEHDAIVIDREVLSARPRNAPRFATLHIDSARDVCALIREILPYERPTKDRISQLMQTSARTLQRRLNDWGISFEEMLDDIRKNQAMKLLEGGNSSVLEVAYLVGYSDPAHLTRAFRRWTGVSPRSFRNANRIEFDG
jgi:AraC-like DNA-binding protein